MGEPKTVGETARELCESLWVDAAPAWPPDAFAIAGSILASSGAYVEVVREWPPATSDGDWCGWIADVGQAWRVAYNQSLSAPAAVQQWWEVMRVRQAVAVNEVHRHRALVEALLQLVAAADEASGGVGTPLAPDKSDRFHLFALGLLEDSTVSVCHCVDPSRARVLPKMRTPQTGITMRSLTGNLALIPARDVEPRWHQNPRFLNDEPDVFNVVAIPYPFEVLPREFRALPANSHGLFNLPSCYGVFEYARPSQPAQVADLLSGALRAARRIVGPVQAVVLPEAALMEPELERVAETCDREGVILMAGVAGKRAGRDRNYCVVHSGRTYEQEKHHRWCLDDSQIRTYGLGSALNPARKWWEAHAPSARRDLHFISWASWLTTTVLLCEDLARQDPVSDLVRAVGPNLVVALLMDGPQLPERWPGRYATVLAEDPGSSVLSLSSLGMVALSRPPGSSPSRVVGLWRDPWSPPVQLSLPTDACGLVLSLSKDFAREYLADGRDDRETSGHVRLSGVHPLYLSES